MNVKDGLYGAFIAAMVSIILWFLNYYFLEDPKIKLEHNRLELEKNRAELDRIREDNEKRNREMRFIQDGIALVKIEDLRCYEINKNYNDKYSIWYECSFLNKSKRVVSTKLAKENFSLEQFNDGKFQTYEQNDRYLLVDNIQNATNIGPDSYGIIRFKLSSKDRKYNIQGFISEKQITVKIPFILDENFTIQLISNYPNITKHIEKDSNLSISLKL
ncbi:hypothetical protein ACTHR3_05080 [Neisseria sp. P0005.S008]|uniref:hypothetical protein n=1 Tax=Neisseria sp. P0005.S008 TaxID=3436682 RepID=UPI003F7CDEC5